MIKNILATTAFSALLAGGAAAQAATPGTAAHPQVAQATAGSSMQSTASGKSVHLSGTVVDLISYVRNNAQTGANAGNTNNSNNGNANNNNNNNNNGNNGKANNNNNNNNNGSNAAVERPLAIVSNGHAYMIDLPESHTGLDHQLARSLGRSVTVNGHVYERGGESIVVVDSMA